MDQLKSREFWITISSILFAEVVGTMLLWYGKVTAEQWVSIVQWVPTSLAGIFAVSKTAQKFIDSRSPSDAPATEEAPK